MEPARPSAVALRMRRFRARQRAAGLKQTRTWLPAQNAVVYSDHLVLDARSLALHCLIARKIVEDPRLLDVARLNLAAWKRARPSGQRPTHLGEWERILRQPWARVAAFISGMSADAIRLRQSSPFAGILDPAERRRVYEAFRA